MQHSVFCILLLCLSGCQVSQIEFEESVQKDVIFAVAQGDKRLIARASHGLDIPAVAAENMLQIKEQCGIKHLAHFGDTVSAASQLASHYALLYNRSMLTHCQPDD